MKERDLLQGHAVRGLSAAPWGTSVECDLRKGRREICTIAIQQMVCSQI